MGIAHREIFGSISTNIGRFHNGISGMERAILYSRKMGLNYRENYTRLIAVWETKLL